jgi:hypothetical protein
MDAVTKNAPQQTGKFLWEGRKEGVTQGGYSCGAGVDVAEGGAGSAVLAVLAELAVLAASAAACGRVLVRE